MVKTLLLALAAAVTTPSIAGACMNEVQLTTDDYVRVLVKAERQLEAGELALAKRTMGRMAFPKALRDRASDIRSVITLRTSRDPGALEGARSHFAMRADANPKDLRSKAWLAEAQLALGAKDEARAILVELRERDLMPDAYAIHALAKLSTGAERYELYKACRARAKNKAMCELPAEKAASR